MPAANQSAREQLTDRRLDALEEATKGHRQVERDTDHLKIGLTHLTEMFGEFKGESRADMAEFKAEVRERDGNTQTSLARLHERFDEIEKLDARELGAREARGSMLRTLLIAVPASASVSAVIVSLLNLLLN